MPILLRVLSLNIWGLYSGVIKYMLVANLLLWIKIKYQESLEFVSYN